MTLSRRLLSVLILVAAAAPAAADEALRQAALQRFGRLEPASDAQRNAPEAELGRALFWDVRISADGRTACASCHPAADWGSDARRYSIDARGKPTARHSQTVFNAMRQATLRWTGDRPSGAAQAEGSLTGSLGYGSKDDALAAVAAAGYGPRFQAVFGGDGAALNAANYGRALAAYQSTLATPAAFDRFLGGDDAALDTRQQAGLRTFLETGCAGCHDGALLGGTSLQRFGVVRDYWLATGSSPVDIGRYGSTKKEEDRYVFRVAMLRNITRTAPYFHDGSVARLDDAVRVMAEVQLGRTLADEQVAALVAFLESLTGEVPPNYAPPR